MLNLMWKKRWFRLTATVIVFLLISVGLGVAVRIGLQHFQIPLDQPLWMGLLIIFGLLLLINLSVLPLPFGITLLLVAATVWNPVMIALAGSLGASIGEFTSYFFGRLGKRVAINEETFGYLMIQRWVNKYGMWAISFLSFQPVLPFEIGGFIAGISKMPIKRFLPAIWIGKFPKYLILIYLGKELMSLFPFLGTR